MRTLTSHSFLYIVLQAQQGRAVRTWKINLKMTNVVQMQRRTRLITGAAVSVRRVVRSDLTGRASVKCRKKAGRLPTLLLVRVVCTRSLGHPP